MKIGVPFLLAIVIIGAVSTLGGSMIWAFSQNIQYTVIEDPLEFPVGASLIQKMAIIYSSQKYSNVRGSSCFREYLKENSKEKRNLIDACGPALRDIDLNSVTSTDRGVENILILSEIINNPRPVINYLILNKARWLKDEYREVFSKYVLAESFKGNFYKVGDPTRYSLLAESWSLGEQPYIVEFMNISNEVFLALIRDIKSSGAYNIYGSIYQVSFLGQDITVKMAKMIYTDPKGVSLVDQIGKEFESGLTNAYFDRNDRSLHVLGFLGFHAYPCYSDDRYSFFKDRLILVSSGKAKDCSKYNIQNPNDVPDNFDRTEVIVYEISPNILEKAKRY